MSTRITTFVDARRIVSAWVEAYHPQPTDAQIEHAARLLVTHIGGSGHELTPALTDSFALDEALGDA